MMKEAKPVNVETSTPVYLALDQQCKSTLKMNFRMNIVMHFVQRKAHFLHICMKFFIPINYCSMVAWFSSDFLPFHNSLFLPVTNRPLLIDRKIKFKYLSECQEIITGQNLRVCKSQCLQNGIY